MERIVWDSQERLLSHLLRTIMDFASAIQYVRQGPKSEVVKCTSRDDILLHEVDQVDCLACGLLGMLQI